MQIYQLLSILTYLQKDLTVVENCKHNVLIVLKQLYKKQALFNNKRLEKKSLY